MIIMEILDDKNANLCKNYKNYSNDYTGNNDKSSVVILHLCDVLLS